MIHEAFSRLRDAGFSENKIKISALFYNLIGDGEIKRGFGHRNYGFSKRGVSKTLAEHVLGPTRWFRGNGGDKKSPMARAEALISRLTSETSSNDDFDQPLLFSHDIAFKVQNDETKEWVLQNPAEQSCKVFVVCSPWQFLNTLGLPTETKKTQAIALFSNSVVASPQSKKFDEKWLVEGQPLNDGNYPSCSMYAARFDSENPDYVLTLDVDGKVCMTDKELKEKNGARVADLFEFGENDKTPLLLQISTSVKSLLKKHFDDVTCFVSWHKSIGWKPSWRAYVVGPIFQNIDIAKYFVRHLLVPALQEESWFVDDLIDDRTFQKGFDRCIGSAKLDTVNDMRFMDQHPLEISDHELKEIFGRCPNEYTLRCLGIVLPENYFTNPLAKVNLLQVPPGVNLKTKKRKHGRDAFLNVNKERCDAESVASDLVQKVLRENNFISESTSWIGTHLNIQKTDHKYIINLRAANDSFFCVFKEFEEVDGELKKRSDASKHTSSGKQIFKIVATSEKAVLRQTCFHCQKPEKQLCPLNTETFAQVQNLLFDTSDEDDNEEPPQKIDVEKWSLL